MPRHDPAAAAHADRDGAGGKASWTKSLRLLSLKLDVDLPDGASDEWLMGQGARRRHPRGARLRRRRPLQDKRLLTHLVDKRAAPAADDGGADRDAGPVLNAFSYTGGFSLAALQGGSASSLDASRPAAIWREPRRNTSAPADAAVRQVAHRLGRHLPVPAGLDPPAMPRAVVQGTWTSSPWPSRTRSRGRCGTAGRQLAVDHLCSHGGRPVLAVGGHPPREERRLPQARTSRCRTPPERTLRFARCCPKAIGPARS